MLFWCIVWHAVIPSVFFSWRVLIWSVYNDLYFLGSVAAMILQDHVSVITKPGLQKRSLEIQHIQWNLSVVPPPLQSG